METLFLVKYKQKLEDQEVLGDKQQLIEKLKNNS
jgi:hypothetical protein